VIILLAHTDETIVGSDHEEAVVWLAAQHTKDRGSEILLVASEIRKANDFGLSSTLGDSPHAMPTYGSLPNLFPRQLPPGHC
jgi:hypothetical protein